jgi:hypothetical protein
MRHKSSLPNPIPNPLILTITIAPDAEGGVGASKNGKNGAKTCQAFILFFFRYIVLLAHEILESLRHKSSLPNPIPNPLISSSSANSY